MYLNVFIMRQWQFLERLERCVLVCSFGLAGAEMSPHEGIEVKEEKEGPVCDELGRYDK